MRCGTVISLTLCSLILLGKQSVTAADEEELIRQFESPYDRLKLGRRTREQARGRRGYQEKINTITIVSPEELMNSDSHRRVNSKSVSFGSPGKGAKGTNSPTVSSAPTTFGKGAKGKGKFPTMSPAPTTFGKGAKGACSGKGKSCVPSAMPSLSAAPSLSAMPSLAPSQSPSAMPSLAPSQSPSMNPSVSMMPSLAPSQSPSMNPSVSMVPSTLPSQSPTCIGKGKGCKSPSGGKAAKGGKAPTVSPAPSILGGKAAKGLRTNDLDSLALNGMIDQLIDDIQKLEDVIEEEEEENEK